MLLAKVTELEKTMSQETEDPQVDSKSAGAKSSAMKWLKRAVWVLVAAAVLVVTYLILAALIPRWWAQRMGALIEGGFLRGTTWGLFFGTVCTLVPLLLLLVAVLMWRKRSGKVVAVVSVLAGLVAAIPNLMTLTVVLGGGNGAHAGQRIMDVDAPAFRGSSAIGAIIAVLIFLVIAFLVFRYRRRGKQLRTVRAEQKEREAEKESAAGESAAGE